MENIKKPKDAGEAFVQKQVSMQKRFSEKDIGMATGNALTNAVNLAIAIYAHRPDAEITAKDYQDQIKFWLDWLYNTSSEKKEYEAIPVIKEVSPTPPVKIPPHLDEMAEAKKLKMEEEGYNFGGNNSNNQL